LSSKDEAGAFVEVNGFKLFYMIFGSGSDVLLCLHGGPGGTHYSLLPLGKLGDDKIKVVLYDQLGCCNSEKPKDIGIFTIKHYVEEVEGIRQALNLGKINLMGHSWGGMLALEYALKYQQNLKKLILTGSLASVPEYCTETARLKTLLPTDVQETLDKYETLWAFWHPDYQKAVDVWNRNFLCRLPQLPEDLTRSRNHLSAPVYYTMWGPNEFTALGKLRDWDITARLSEIDVPTLVACGRYDEVTPQIAERIHDRIRGSKLVILENSAHAVMWEEEQKYLTAVREFVLS
jgi:proline iminopeptidase